MSYYAIKDTNGEIQQTASASGSGTVRSPNADWSVAEVDHAPDKATEYIKNGEITTRPTFDAFDKLIIAADGNDAATIQNVPSATTVTVDNAQTWTVGDGVFRFSTTTPAAYIVRVERWPYQVLEVEITAT